MQSGFLYRGHCVGIGTGTFILIMRLLIGNILMVSMDTEIKRKVRIPRSKISRNLLHQPKRCCLHVEQFALETFKVIIK